jgi:CSLREA domain-containing protein
MKTKHWLMFASLALVATATAQTKPFAFLIAGKSVQLPTLEQNNQVYVDITQLGKAMGFGVTIDRTKRTIALSNTTSAVAKLTPPVSPNAPIQVNTTADTVDVKPGDARCNDVTGQCSIRAAIAEVLAQKLTREIRIPNGTYTLERGALTIPNGTGNFEVRFKGESAEQVVIDPDARDRAFLIGFGRRVRLENLTIRNGVSSEAGGAVLVNLPTNDMPNSVLTIKNSKFFANRAAREGGAIAVYTWSAIVQVNIEDSEFSGNSASGHGGAISVIKQQFNTQINIKNTTFTENRSGQAGGAVYSNAASVVSSSRFLKNVAAVHGGGLATTLSPASVNTSTFEGNQAEWGGAIAVLESTTTSTFDRLTITGNQGQVCGGGIVIKQANATIQKSSISRNEIANGDGGGVCSYLASVLLSGSTINGNRAANGGGVWVGGVNPFNPSTPSQARLVNTTVSGNIAGAKGGAIFSSRPYDQLDISASTFVENQAADTKTNQLQASNLQIRGSVLQTSNGQNCLVDKTESAGFNISSDASCEFSSRGDQKGVSPKLGELADNGGGVLTHLPLVDSPVLDVIPLSVCEARDARDVNRPQGSACDVGAVERSATDK